MASNDNDLIKVNEAVKLYTAFVKSKDEFSLGETAKLLRNFGSNLGRNQLTKELRRLEIFMEGTMPYEKYIASDYFRVILANKNDIKVVVTLVTPKGFLFLLERVFKLTKDGSIA